MINKFRSKIQGFTLIELLVVISIIAILIALGSAAYSIAQAKGRNAKRRADMKALQDGFEQYYAGEGTNSYGASCGAMTGDADYFPAGAPVDPKNTGDYIYDITNCNSSSYCICAYLEDETGNSTNSNCNYASSGSRPYYCLSNLQ